jgi:uncharacterized protein YjiS (DUF1127 family)
MRAQATLMKAQTNLQATSPQLRLLQTMRLRRRIAALQSLDDRTLSQIGIERDEIERFAHAEVAHNL